MVGLTQIHASNALVSSKLPPHLVAVFIGGSAGIGLFSLKAFVKHANQPRVYITGRSQANGDQAVAECRQLNPKGEYIFMPVDGSLLKNVDELCDEIKKRETAINVLFLTQGTLTFTGKTTEGLNYLMALGFYARLRIITNLLPLLQQATHLRRVITVLAGTKEGPILSEHFSTPEKVPMSAARGHLVSMTTMALVALQKRAPNVAFVHSYPGFVKTNLGRDAPGLLIATMRFVMSIRFALFGRYFQMNSDECGERHVFLATSRRYGPVASVDDGIAVEGVVAAKGILQGSGMEKNRVGVYCVDDQCEVPGGEWESLINDLVNDGMVGKVWDHVEGEFMRITGKA